MGLCHWLPTLLAAHGSSPPPSACAGASESLRIAYLLGIRLSQLRVRLRRRRVLVPHPYLPKDGWKMGLRCSVGGLAHGPMSARSSGLILLLLTGAFHPGEADLRPLPQTCMQAGSPVPEESFRRGNQSTPKNPTPRRFLRIIFRRNKHPPS